MQKRCNTCKELKDIKNFWKNSSNRDGLQRKCRSCWEEYNKNPDNKKRKRDYYQHYNSLLEKKERKKEIRQTAKYKKQAKEYQKKDYYKEYQKRYRRERRLKDPAFKLAGNLRIRHNKVLKGVVSTTKGLGCNTEFLRKYIEDQFAPGMTWENHGNKRGCWSIDHKLPLDLLKTNPELTSKLIHYTNLQPMWHTDNLKKSNS